MLYNDSDADSYPRQKETGGIILAKYENNTIYVKLKLDKIKQIVNKKSTSKKKLDNEHDEDNVVTEYNEDNDYNELNGDSERVMYFSYRNSH
jgi:hypothetical protein